MKSAIKSLLTVHAKRRIRPDGSTYTALLHYDEMKISEASGLSPKDVQIAALQDDIIPERYCRNQKVLDNGDQIKLLQSHVAIIGQGGLGGTVTEILARIGIGRLTLVDGDVFEDSNLNRQLLANTTNLGQNKAVTGKKRVRLLNPAVEVRAVTDFFSEKNSVNILSNAGLAVDCLDSITDRLLVEDACKKTKIPLVSAAIGGASGQALVIFPGDQGLRRIYGDSVPQKGIEAQLGTLPFAAVFMAAVQCAEAVSLICRNSSRLQNRMILADMFDHSLEVISL